MTAGIVELALGATRRLSFAPTVARRLVHKAADSQVLLTDAQRVGRDRFLVAAAWAPDHLLYYPGPSGAGDPTLLVESMRQSAIYLSHRFYRVPTEDVHFVLSRLSADFAPGGLPYDPGAELPAVMDITCARATGKPGRFAMQLSVSLYIHGRWCGRADFRWAVLPQEKYEVLRRRNSPGAADGAAGPSAGPAGDAMGGSMGDSFVLRPSAVGRRHHRDVLLAADPRLPADTWRLRLDRSHPVHFDHDSDHVPGMVLLEAMQQAAHAAYVREFGPLARLAPRVLSSLDTGFHCFGELDRPVDIVVGPMRDAGRARAGFEVSAVQGGRTLADARFAGAAPSWSLLSDREAVSC
ncbi:ScbA/BarX family gamma-butyrolactone biosynthesis protein [Streptomyces roseoverticillatus]|uniref:ScbA/BarX family gamma-butyrolactone biosynthesis protein n=1 Tax=Streptomyces roseoverticillatus TaxID=66429 RepID=UPI0033CC59D7